MESGKLNELDYMDDAAFEDYLQEGGESWSWWQNKAFYNALGTHTDDTGDRWEKIAAEVPGKAVDDVVIHYQLLEGDVVAIDGDRIPLPSYSVDEVAGGGQGKQSGEGKAPRAEQERRKGIVPSEEEHRNVKSYHGSSGGTRHTLPAASPGFRSLLVICLVIPGSCSSLSIYKEIVEDVLGG